MSQGGLSISSCPCLTFFQFDFKLFLCDDYCFFVFNLSSIEISENDTHVVQLFWSLSNQLFLVAIVPIIENRLCIYFWFQPKSRRKWSNLEIFCSLLSTVKITQTYANCVYFWQWLLVNKSQVLVIYNWHFTKSIFGGFCNDLRVCRQ